MITFKQFLEGRDTILEAMVKPWFTKKVDPEMAVNFLNQHASDGLTAIKNGGLIYRGFTKAISGSEYSGAPKSFVAVDSSTGSRTSRDTDNAYQICMDYSPALAGWPKRGKSFICSTRMSTAEGYGDAYVMVPLNGTKIAVAPIDDIFRMDIEGPISAQPDDFSAPFNAFFKSLGASQRKGSWNDPIELNAVLAKFSPEYLAVLWDVAINDSSMTFYDDEVENAFYNISTSYHGMNEKSAKNTTYVANHIKHMGFPKKCNKSTKEIYELLKSAKPKERFFALAGAIMTPKTTGCTLVTYGESLPRQNEVWFSGKAMAIPFGEFADMLVTLDDQKFPIHKNVMSDWKYRMMTVRKAHAAHAKTVAKSKVSLKSTASDGMNAIISDRDDKHSADLKKSSKNPVKKKIPDDGPGSPGSDYF